MSAGGAGARITDMTWPEIRGLAARGAVAVVPTGSCEQHGPHLAVRTDSTLVTAVAEAAVARLPPGRAAIAPTLWLGASHHHLPFFALSVDESTYVRLAAQIGTSLAEAGFRRVFFLNGHGGNASPLRLAATAIRRARPDTLVAAAEYWALAAPAIRAIRETPPGGAAHAGEFETSLMLRLDPDGVRPDRLAAVEPVYPRLPPAFVRDLVDGGAATLAVEWEALTSQGALGDPTRASAEKGQAFFAAAAQAAADTILAFADLDADALRPQSAD